MRELSETVYGITAEQDGANGCFPDRSDSPADFRLEIADGRKNTRLSRRAA
jgi:hypothetical protein